MSESWRLFIAIELPAEVLKVIEELQEDLKQAIPIRAARWTRPEGIHLTLKFLGDVSSDQVDSVSAGLRDSATGHTAFDLAVQGIGCFPDLRRPRVLWVGVGGETDRLRTLHSSVEKHITPLGFPTEARGFNPHLTLARTAQQASRDDIALIGKVASERDVGQLAAWRADAVSLMRSHLHPDGVRYEQVGAAPLSR